jgi:hypothetical protein
MRYRAGLLLASTLTLGLISASPAHADLIELDGWVTGDRALTSDTATGLSWLDLSVTNNRSFTDIFVNDFGGLSSLGFRLATMSEATMLLHNAGAPPGAIPGSTPVTTDTVSAASAFISLFGCTACSTVYSEGFVVSETNRARFAWAEVRSDGTGGFGMSAGDGHSFAPGSFGRDHHQPGAGFFLVTDTALIDGLFEGPPPPAFPPPSPASVPEPGTLYVMIAGCVALYAQHQLRSTLAARSPSAMPPADLDLIRIGGQVD